jgi:transcriptional regulator with PAS, ATPase and Fis domain
VASEAMKQVIRLVQRVAQTKAFVLIRGETGTGKEHVARAIHHFSLRHAKPWVDVNCGALPAHLMESELFGHERGAFSGADSAKPGLFELAHTGTIFLDEIAELNPVMQVKLLRVLDGTPYYRLGGVKKVSVDVRIIAATNRDLEQATAEGSFRRDLYYRLNELTIQVPPLRHRTEDVVPLAMFFLRNYSDRAYFSPDAEDVLRGWSWPGNVRELRNVVTNAAVLFGAREK